MTTKMMKLVAGAAIVAAMAGGAFAVGTPSRPGGYGGFPQCDTIFDRALRYRETLFGIIRIL